ncbi:MAG: ATPase [Rhodobacteraceae bacterium]|jgi:hypothetical protein|nr:ATPase [Paracoccaceae bacterium]MBL4558760.1 ATPase [Paracoccaceae bacterium]HBH00092.1 ATPase [Paracoccaceae bacterium]
MLYRDGQDWRDAPQKRVLLFGMSGLGKTHIADMLRRRGGWYHYSVDYRIGTRYLGEEIDDMLKAAAMGNRFLAGLLKSDSITIRSKIGFGDLAPLSAWLGKPGDPARGGIPIAEYRRRQAVHMAAERAAMLDTARFIARARALYGYQHFVCDSSGSICEVVDPNNPEDPVLTALATQVLPVWIEGTAAHRDELIRRFDAAPKPMCYEPAFLDAEWTAYLAETGLAPEAVDPDAFVRHVYARALDHRKPRYAALARNWGVTVTAEDMAALRVPDDFVALIGRALDAQGT